MHLYPIKTGIIHPQEHLARRVLDAVADQDLKLKNHDLLVITSKVVSFSEGRLVRLDHIKPSPKAQKLAVLYDLKAEFAELILQESDCIYGGVEKAILTLKQGVLTANAGVDNKNVQNGYAILWPANPKESAQRIRQEINQMTARDVAIMIIDSGLTPLRVGTIAFALAVAGFKPIEDKRGSLDLFGKPVMITRQAVADDLASAAHLLMGEAAEGIPVVLVRKAPVVFDDCAYDSADMMMPLDQCIFTGAVKLQS